MGLVRRISSLRQEQILGHIEPYLDEDEAVVRWARARDPGSRRSGFVYLTPRRIVILWPGRKRGYAAHQWDEIASWGVRWWSRGGPVLSIRGAAGSSEAQMPAETRKMAENATRFLEEVARRAPVNRSATVPDRGVEPERRSLTQHTRRVVTSVVGLVLVVVGLILSAPGVPGPGILTILAGLGVLATEYDWAKDLQHWMLIRARKLGRRLRRDRDDRPD